MFIDFSRNINNLKDMIVFEITNLLNRHNLDRLDLIPCVTDDYGYKHLPHYFYNSRGTIQLPSYSYCDCGDYEVAHLITIIKKGNKWIGAWNDNGCDYEALTPEECAGDTDFSLRDINDLAMLYNRVYAILTNPNLFEEEKQRIEEEDARRVAEHEKRLAIIRKIHEEEKQDNPNYDALAKLKQMLEA